MLHIHTHLLVIASMYLLTFQLCVQVSLQQQPQYTCACIFLLSEVLKSKPPLWLALGFFFSKHSQA